MAPLDVRKPAWARLAKDLNAAALETVATDVKLADAAGLADDLLAGKVKGRVVVDVNA